MLVTWLIATPFWAVSLTNIASIGIINPITWALAIVLSFMVSAILFT